MAAKGVSLLTLQRLMGHAYPETTMQYVNLSMNDLLDEFQRAVRNIAKSYQPL